MPQKNLADLRRVVVEEARQGIPPSTLIDQDLRRPPSQMPGAYDQDSVPPPRPGSADGPVVEPQRGPGEQEQTRGAEEEVGELEP